MTDEPQIYRIRDFRKHFVGGDDFRAGYRAGFNLPPGKFPGRACQAFLNGFTEGLSDASRSQLDAFPGQGCHTCPDTSALRALFVPKEGA
jgi:hypothetical protein